MYGQRIRELRMKIGLTAKEFGDKFNLAESTISGYENENRKPDIELIGKFADFFDVNSDYILGRTNDPTPPGKRKNMEMEINVAYLGGARHELSEEEATRLEEELEMFRLLKAKKMREKKD